MRPRYLEIEGLQSFRESQKIDFDRLSETGLFGIFGPTGCGKSTVLDAITLALYGEVHRAVRGTQGIINTNAGSVKVAFTFDLLKGSTRKTFRVERVYNRKKGSENSCEAKVARLIEITEAGESPVADKAGEVSAKVEELIGLKLDDFTRSVVLPQNKFQEFLLLEKSKKREMLERIFYLEEYGKQLTERVNGKLTNVRYRLTNIDGAMSALGDASEKALIEAESKMQSAHENREKLDKELKQEEMQYNEAKEVWELVSDLEYVAQKERQHLSGLEMINEKKKLYENAVKANDLLDGISKFRNAVRNLEDTEVQLNVINNELPELIRELAKSKSQYEDKALEVKREIPLLIEQKHKLTEAMGVQKEISDIDIRLKMLRESYTHIKEQTAAKDKEIKDKKDELEGLDKRSAENKLAVESLKVDIDYRKEVQTTAKLEEDLLKAGADMQAQQSKHDELADRVVRLENELREFSKRVQTSQNKSDELKSMRLQHENSKSGDRNQILQDIGSFHNMKSIYESLKSVKCDRDKINTRLNEINVQIEHHKTQCTNSGKLKVKLEAQLDSLREQVGGLQKQFEKHTAYILAQSLKDGEACPVCGSVHHPVPASDAPHEDIVQTEAQLNEALEKLAKAEKQHREAENGCIKLNEQLKSLESQHIRICEDLSFKQAEYAELLQKLPDHMQNMQHQELDAELKIMEDGNASKLKAVEVWEKKLEEIKKDAIKLDELLSVQKIEEGSKNAELEVNRETLVQSKKAIDEAAKGLFDKNQSYTACVDRLRIDSAVKELERIEQKDRRMEKSRKQGEQLHDMAKASRDKLEQVAESRRELENQRVEIENDGKNFKTQRDEKERKIKLLAGDKNIGLELKVIEEKTVIIQHQEKELYEQVKCLEARQNELNTHQSALNKQKEMYGNEVRDERARLDEALEKKGFANIEAAGKAILPKEEQDRLNKAIQEFEETRKRLETQKYLVSVKLGGRKLTEDAWHEMCSNYQAKKQEKEDSISIFEGARNIYNTVKNNFDKWMKLNNEMQVYSRKKEMLEQIQKLLKGNSFIEYIAEERLRYIAKEASETLGVLTKYRYALELDTENGFIIRDNANGGVHRFVSSLSGGETFLTSLSLALALSKQIQLKGQSPLEFFFLDEGFGTLDSNLLDTVIDSLERLSTKERIIGLITHIPELKNRITRRLVVEPPTSDGRGSLVRIEKA